MRFRIGLFIGLLILSFTVVAQIRFDIEEYQWIDGDFALRIPDGWETATLNKEGGISLEISQAFASSPESRPPAIPFFRLIVFSDVAEDADLYGLLETELRTIDIQATGPANTRFLANDFAIVTTGISSDEFLFGIGYITRLDDGRGVALLGRGNLELRDNFIQLAEIIANSIVDGVDTISQALEYGVLWHVALIPADTLEPYINLQDIVYQDGRLFALDLVFGVLELDPSTGDIIEVIDIPEDNQPTQLIANDSALYVSDLLCRCVHRYQNDEWDVVMDEFNLGFPNSIALDDTGTLYAVDQTSEFLQVRALAPDATEPQVFSFEALFTDIPFLISPDGEQLLAIFALGNMYQLDGVGFTQLDPLQLSNGIIRRVSRALDGAMLVSTFENGIFIMNTEGEILNRLGRIVVGYPLAGELVSANGVTVNPSDGTIYWVDSDGTYGNISALSTSIERGRVGQSTLSRDIAVQGTLDEVTTEQSWSLPLQVGDRVTITTTSLTSGFDIALRIFAPDGTEIAYILDDETRTLRNFFDARLLNYVAEQDGDYEILVESTFGVGNYELGATQLQTIDLNTTSSVTGNVSEVLPHDVWQFDATAGQTITLTMLATSGFLDPILRIYDADGELLEENDDALDGSLGRGSRIQQFEIPSDGVYYIESGRFNGDGGYELTIE